MSKPRKWWAIKMGRVLLPFTIRTTRRDAIQAGIDLFPRSAPDWPTAQKNGYSVVKVEVREIETEAQ